MLRPEWGQGLYLKLREHYLTTHGAKEVTILEPLVAKGAKKRPGRSDVDQFIGMMENRVGVKGFAILEDELDRLRVDLDPPNGGACP